VKSALWESARTCSAAAPGAAARTAQVSARIHHQKIRRLTLEIPFQTLLEQIGQWTPQVGGPQAGADRAVLCVEIEPWVNAPDEQALLRPEHGVDHFRRLAHHDAGVAELADRGRVWPES